MKTDVYSWRLSEELKADLEREARLRRVSVSAILETAVRDLLKKSATGSSDEQRQLQIRQNAARWLGALDSGNPRRAETVRQTLRQKLRQRHGR